MPLKVHRMIRNPRGTTVFYLVGAVLVLSLMFAGKAFAQSAADKATARKLATEGIALFQKGDIAEALDKLERAQTLYDAPIHLLYIARAQVKLNRLVEGTETYRKLTRVELLPGSPQTFVDAVADGRRELPEVEPKVPTLRVDVVPAKVKDLQLTIDGEAVSAAVLGVDRPVNPGDHEIKISAPHYQDAETTVSIAVEEQRTERIELKPAVGEEAAAAAAVGGADQGGSSGAGQGSEKDQGATQADEKPGLSILLALRLGGAFPGGDIDKNPRTSPANNDVVVDHRVLGDRTKTGGGLELQAGFGIPAGPLVLTPLLALEVYAYQKGAYYEQSATTLFAVDQGASTRYEIKPNSGSAGIGLRTEYQPARAQQFGGFLELLFLPVQTFTINGTLTQDARSCDLNESFSGPAFKIGGGALFSLTRRLRMSAQIGMALGSFTQRNVETDCDEVLEVGGFSLPRAGDRNGVKGDETIPSDQRAVHSLLTFGLGGEYSIGL